MALTLTNYDIVQSLEMLSSEILKADGGTTNTLISDDLSELGDATIAGYLIVFLSGDVIGQEAYITGGTNGTYTLDTTLTNSIANKTKFTYLEGGFKSFISRAESILTSHFRNKGMNIDLFLNNAQLKELHIYKTVELICLSKRNSANDDDAYHSNYIAFKDLYEAEFSNLVADYDTNENGVIDDGEELQQIGQVSFVR